MTKRTTPTTEALLELLPPLPTINQVAKATGFNPKTIRRRVDDGTLKAHRFGPRCIRIERDSVMDLLTPVTRGELAPESWRRHAAPEKS
jgi:excisionase family DNA binding protein